MSPTPVRLQRSRAKGSKLVSPNGLPVVCVTRPGRWGNPFRYQKDARANVGAFMFWLINNKDGRKVYAAAKVELRGKNLACWCKLCESHSESGKPLNESCPNCNCCHVDVLGEIANA